MIRTVDREVAGGHRHPWMLSLPELPRALGSAGEQRIQFGLEFLAGQVDNEFASALRLTPRAEHFRRPVCAGDGAFYGLGLTGTTGLEPAPLQLTAGCSTFKLRSQGGIHRLAPTDALHLSTQFWWSSHSSSPFSLDWLLRSFLSPRCWRPNSVE